MSDANKPVFANTVSPPVLILSSTTHFGHLLTDPRRFQRSLRTAFTPREETAYIGVLEQRVTVAGHDEAGDENTANIGEFQAFLCVLLHHRGVAARPGFQTPCQ